MTDLTTVRDQGDDWWRDSAERAVRWWAESGMPFDAYDVTLLGVPDPDHPSRWGGLFSAMKADGIIEPIGYRESRRPSRHHGVCRIWRGTTAVTAVEVAAA